MISCNLVPYAAARWRSVRQTAADAWGKPALVIMLIAFAATLSACSTTPLIPYTEEGPPLMLVPVSHAGVQDKRGRFREIFCRVLKEHGAALPDHRSCDEALTKVGEETGGSGAPVRLGPARRPLMVAFVPGVGWDCFEEWLKADNSIAEHLRHYGYGHFILEVDSIAGSGNNAARIRDAIMAMEHPTGEGQLVLVGYSKGRASRARGAGR